MRDSTRPAASEIPNFDWAGALLVLVWAAMIVAAIVYLTGMRLL